MPHLNDHTAAAHYLPGFALAVDLAQTNPLAELLVVVDLRANKDGVTLRHTNTTTVFNIQTALF